MGVVPTVVLNDLDGLAIGKVCVLYDPVMGMVTTDTPVDPCSIDASMYFHDDNIAMYRTNVTMEAMNTAQAELGTAATSVTAKAETTGAIAVSLANGLPNDADDYAGRTPAYGNGMVEIVATDDGKLWTTQEFYVRRNRRPINADGRATSFNVGTIGAAGVSYTIDEKENTATVDIRADAIFTDDDTLRFDPDRYVVADSEFVSVSISGGTATVMGEKGGATELTLQAVDTGNLKSTAYTFAINVDPGPTATKKELQAITASLSQDAPTGGPVYRLLAVSSYFAHTPHEDVDPNETLEYSGVSSDDDIAIVGDHNATDDYIDITLKAIGEVTISLTAKESGGTPVAPLQSVTRTVTLNVQE
jgi:hypothetical protein